MKSFSELTRREMAIELLRWICVVPIAILVGLAGHLLIVTIALPIMRELSYEGTGRWLRHLIGGIPSGVAFVVAGAKTAPRFHRGTAVALAICSITSAIVVHWPRHRDIIPIIAATVSAIGGVACLIYFEQPKAPQAQPNPHTDPGK